MYNNCFAAFGIPLQLPPTTVLTNSAHFAMNKSELSPTRPFKSARRALASAASSDP
jgi:hypothetical protein